MTITTTIAIAMAMGTIPAVRRPHQQRQRVGEQRGKLPWPTSASAATQLVRAVHDESPRRLAVRQPVRTRAKIAQQQLDALGQLELRRCADLEDVRHARPHATIPAMSSVDRTPTGRA